MNWLGLDINGTRARGVLGSTGDYPTSLPMEPPAHELPMIFSLEGWTADLGSPGFRLLRHQPHLTVSDFLPHLGHTGSSAKIWKHGRSKLDASAVMQQVWKRLQPMCAKTRGVVVAVPGYLTHEQADLVRQLGEKAKIPVIGTVPAPLAAALVGFAEQTWSSSVLVVDVDDHALTLSIVRSVTGQAHLLDTRTVNSLSLRAWKQRLLDVLADFCVWQSRRDPRDSPVAEQRLYEQLDSLLEATLMGRIVQIGIQGNQWYQNILIHPDKAGHSCTALVRQALNEADLLFRNLPHEEIPSVVLMTNAAGRLPGLAQALRQKAEAMIGASPVAHEPRRTAVEDFGEGLLRDVNHEPSRVVVLSPDAVARAAHALATHFQSDLPRGHVDLMAPLPLPQPLEAGPARLQFHGLEFLLHDAQFSMGSHAGCHLPFDPHSHPDVAERHCEIRYDHRAYVLFNRSRQGTLVNDHPVHGSVVLRAGDWIRLGQRGPAVRFLGQPSFRNVSV